jgi:hypothetical protein
MLSMIGPTFLPVVMFDLIIFQNRMILFSAASLSEYGGASGFLHLFPADSIACWTVFAMLLSSSAMSVSPFLLRLWISLLRRGMLCAWSCFQSSCLYFSTDYGIFDDSILVGWLYSSAIFPWNSAMESMSMNNPLLSVCIPV